MWFEQTCLLHQFLESILTNVTVAYYVYPIRSDRETLPNFVLLWKWHVPHHFQWLQQQQEFRSLLHQHLQQPVQLIFSQRWDGLRCVWWSHVNSDASPLGFICLLHTHFLSLNSHSWWPHNGLCFTCLRKSVSQSLYKQWIFWKMERINWFLC